MQNIPTRFASLITDILKYFYGGSIFFGMKIFVRWSPAIPSPMGLCKSPGSHDLWYILTEWAGAWGFTGPASEMGGGCTEADEEDERVFVGPASARRQM